MKDCGSEYLEGTNSLEFEGRLKFLDERIDHQFSVSIVFRWEQA